MWRFAFMSVVLVSPAVQADTIPCTHRYIESKIRETFNFVQEKPEFKTGTRAVKLEEVQETSQKKIAEYNMLVRYCEGILHINNGDMIRVHFRVGSREDYRRDRAEDLQVCWDENKYGNIQVIDQSIGCRSTK